ncbi:VOC family protein [Alkaliflexus imshenetskii]|uniref:VOC family protein n=1 Tax=Alkaliflexus imshenetskii TaxID=286730 RepID=UPI00047D60DE|nr:VOC family protein [Alkaliflexus imshenetskii]
MKIEHIAIWTTNLEALKSYYETYFGAKSNDKYINPTTGFESYFLTFDGGARLEIMRKPDLSESNRNENNQNNCGLTHLAFGASSKEEVNQKAKTLQEAGFQILRGPRTTGDGYYEFETLDPDNNRLEVTTPA